MIERAKIVDIAKGICISLVIFNHGDLAELFPKINHAMALFRMPLFFFLSGIFFKETLSFHEDLARRTDYLIKPYITMLVLVELFHQIITHDAWPWELEGIFYADNSTIRLTPLWYLSHLWLIHIFCLLIAEHTDIVNKSVRVRSLTVLFLLVSGVIMMYTLRHFSIFFTVPKMHPRGLPLAADILLISSAYFLSGRFLKTSVLSFKPNAALTSGALCIFLMIAILTGTSVNLAYRTYDNWILATVAAICGGYLTLCLAFYVAKQEILSKLFSYLGLSSLFLLIFHQPIGRFIHHTITRNHLIDSNLTTAIISFVGCIVASLAIRCMIIRSTFLSLFFLPLKTNKWIRARLQKNTTLAKPTKTTSSS